MSILQSAKNAIQWAGETLDNISKTIKSNNNKKEMLKNLIQKKASKDYTTQTGKKYTGPSDQVGEWFLQQDKPTQKWEGLYKQAKDKYKYLK